MDPNIKQAIEQVRARAYATYMEDPSHAPESLHRTWLNALAGTFLLPVLGTALGALFGHNQDSAEQEYTKACARAKAAQEVERYARKCFQNDPSSISKDEVAEKAAESAKAQALATAAGEKRHEIASSTVALGLLTIGILVAISIFFPGSFAAIPGVLSTIMPFSLSGTAETVLSSVIITSVGASVGANIGIVNSRRHDNAADRQAEADGQAAYNKAAGELLGASRQPAQSTEQEPGRMPPPITPDMPPRQAAASRG